MELLEGKRMTYEIELKPRALKDLQALPKPTQRRIVGKIAALANELAGDVKRLTNHTPEYRLRVGDYRVLFEIEGDKLIIIACCIGKMRIAELRRNVC